MSTLPPYGFQPAEQIILPKYRLGYYVVCSSEILKVLWAQVQNKTFIYPSCPRIDQAALHINPYKGMVRVSQQLYSTHSGRKRPQRVEESCCPGAYYSDEYCRNSHANISTKISKFTKKVKSNENRSPSTGLSGKGLKTSNLPN